MTSEIGFEDFSKVDVRVGVIKRVEDAPGCRVPAYRLTIDLGAEIGSKVSVAQAKNYEPQSLQGKQVLVVANLAPRQVGKHLSEVLVLGVPTESSGTALIIPDMEARIGGQVF